MGVLIQIRLLGGKEVAHLLRVEAEIAIYVALYVK